MTAASEISRGARAPRLLARDLSAGPPGAPEPVVRGVTLSVARGEWVAVTGPNGAGKTTLVLALAGLWPARAGTREIIGGPDTPGVRPRVVTLLQEPATQLTQRTVRDEVAFTAINLGASAAEAWRSAAPWVARFHLADALERPPQELSAGRQQCVLLAGALAAEPDVLIADEAAAHLDRETRRMALEVLRDRVGAGLAVIWVTQEPGELRWADRWVEVGSGGECSERVLPGATSIRSDTVSSEALDDEAAAAPSAAVRESRGREVRAPSPAASRLRVRIQPRDGARVLRNTPVALEIGSCGVWAVSGPNGSGKSSLLEALAGIESRPEVVIEWETNLDSSPILAGQYPERQIFEERVCDELIFAAVSRGKPRAVATAEGRGLLDSFGLAGLFDRRTWSLSAGEKRLVSIFGALLAPASLILLDEPTCGIDSERRRRLALAVVDYSRRTPVVVASQDRAWIREVRAIEVALGESHRAREGGLA